MSNALAANTVIQEIRITAINGKNRLTTEVNTEVTTEVKKLILNCKGEQTRSQLQQLFGQNDITKSNKLSKNSVIRKFRITANQDCFRKSTIKPAIEQGLLEMTIPDKPNSRMQKYRLTEKGIVLKNDNGKDHV